MALITLLGLLLVFLSSDFPNLNQTIKDSVNAIGFQVAFYYGLACLACAWHWRRGAFRSFGDLILLFLWPIPSAAFLVRA
ncbi:MAG TPA: hypothetical protein VEG25_05040 [Burkholderiales bacterium]|nr:hypothetical protein [Burkholderiales bacterium]